jgi:hypothetical protein
MSFGIVATVAAVGTAVSAGTKVAGAISANKEKKKNERKEDRARREMNRLKDQYSRIDTSNPFLNQENVYEDLTIDQRGAEFERQQFQQSQANIMGGLRQSAGSSGIAALAQQMAQSGQLAAQSSAARIGQQEQANQRLQAGEAGRIQSMERRGELISRQQQRDQVGTLLGMSQQETAMYNENAAQANQAKWDSIQGAGSDIMSFGTNLMGMNKPS